MKFILLFIAICFIGCSSANTNPAPAQGITSFNIGIRSNSDILRVPITEDNVICYVAVDLNTIKSIACMKATQ